jgi:hypothetical protein
MLLRISANFRLFLFIIEQSEVCRLIIFFLCEYVFAHVGTENSAKCQGVKTHQEVDLPDHLQCSSLPSSSYN